MSNQFDFALDADDPATIAKSAFLMSPPFSQDLTVRSLQTQKSFLITDIRLRSMKRKDDPSIYGLDKWAIDIYHKLAAFESKPGVNTRLVDSMGHDVYDRYDNRSITPDTPTQKTVYALSAREVDMLIRAGAYDDPAGTEELLRQQLVGQTWSMPDQVMVTESKVRLPRLGNTIGDSKVLQYPNQEFLLAAVQDSGQKNVIDAHTPGSNMASVMDIALKTMAPGVTPMPDVNHDLEKANDVEVSSTKHQIKSQILSNELDLGVDQNQLAQSRELDLNNDNIEQDQTEQVQSPVLSRDDEKQYQDNITNDVADEVGLNKNQPAAVTANDQKVMRADQKVADAFMEDNADNEADDQSEAPKVNAQNRQQVRRQTIRTTEATADQVANRNVAPATSDVNLGMGSAADIGQVKPELTAARPQPSTARTAAKSLVNNQQSVGSMVDLQAQVDQAGQTSADNMPDFSDVKAPSKEELKQMLAELNQEGVAQQYEEPDYQAAAQESPAAQREKMKLRRRLASQEQAVKDQANKAVAQTNVPQFFPQDNEREL